MNCERGECLDWAQSCTVVTPVVYGLTLYGKFIESIFPSVVAVYISWMNLYACTCAEFGIQVIWGERRIVLNMVDAVGILDVLTWPFNLIFIILLVKRLFVASCREAGQFQAVTLKFPFRNTKSSKWSQALHLTLYQKCGLLCHASEL